MAVSMIGGEESQAIGMLDGRLGEDTYSRFHLISAGKIGITCENTSKSLKYMKSGVVWKSGFV